eukprot:c12215_g1_i4.p1 GENE.c12215_g1_i4~~c12215_g1_i4.p1  ORF type:complete len:430 (-),score=129.43 c12215_g1_i4:173-1429(-)
MVELTEIQRKRVEEFKAFLRIRSIAQEGASSGTYAEACAFLKQICERIGLETQVIECVAKKPILIATWKGQDPSLPSVLLNSHYDVVTVDAAKWKYPPFDAVEDDDGNIFCRGTQDMKCVCIMYLHAVEDLVNDNVTPLRNVHLTYVPDEEIGGVDGMCAFIQTEEFKKLNVGVALDEGLAHPDNKVTVFYGERAAMWGVVTATGNAGHGSRFIPDTAVEKLMRFLNHVYEFRKSEFEKLGGHGCAHSAAKKLGDVTTINVTMLDAGVTRGANGENVFALNVVPAKCVCGFDVRIPPAVPLESFKQRLQEWCDEEGMTWEPIVPPTGHYVTSMSCVWWDTIQASLAAQGVEVEPEIFPAATDSRYLRRLQIPAFGLSPLSNTPILLHDHNEMINANVFLRGIEVYKQLVPALANVTQA